MPSEASSRESRVAMRSKLSSVSVGDRERAVHVGEGEDQIDDDRRDEEAGEQHERRPEEEREVGALASQLRSGEVGHGVRIRRCRRSGNPASCNERHGPASTGTTRQFLITTSLPSSFCSSSTTKSVALVGAEPAGLHALDALEDDRVVLADLRVIGHEARVLEHRRRRDQRPALVDQLRHRLLAVVDRRVIGASPRAACSGTAGSRARRCRPRAPCSSTSPRRRTRSDATDSPACRPSCPPAR